ncbi:hypothetical protein QTN25_003023 [Entamoeba marina]
MSQGTPLIQYDNSNSDQHYSQQKPFDEHDMLFLYGHITVFCWIICYVRFRNPPNEKARKFAMRSKIAMIIFAILFPVSVAIALILVLIFH